MSKITKHITKKWEVSIVELTTNGGKKFKVTRRIPELSVAETKFFKTKEEAKKQFSEWLEYSKRHKNLSIEMPFTYYERTTIAQ